MGKGDKRTRRGKIWAKSYGKTRPHKDASAKRANAGGKDGGARARAKSTGAAAVKPKPKPAAAPAPAARAAADAPRDNETTSA